MICWTLGITEHHNAVDNVLALINLGLLTGHVGRYGSGLNPLRGQNNVQGGGDMGAIPNKLPGFQDIVRDQEARARFETAWGRPIMARYGWHLTDMFHAMESGELTAVYCIGENPVSSEADSQHATQLLENLDTLIVQDIFMTQTAEIADVVFPAANSAFESEGTVTNSERRVQRVRKALDPPGDAKDDIWIIAQLASRFGYDWGELTAREAWDELRSLSPMHAGMSWERLEALGGVAMAVLRRGAPWDAVPARAALGLTTPNGRGRSAVQRRRRRAAGRRADRRVPDPADDRPAAGLVQHRGADGRVHFAAPAAGGDRALAGGRRRARSRRGRARAACPPAAGRGRGAGARLARPPAGSRVHDAALPGRGRDEPADDRSHRPQVGDRRVQGHGDPDREAADGEPDVPSEGRGPPSDDGAADGRGASAIDALLGPPRPGATTGWFDGGHETEGDRTLLLPALHALHAAEGWISEGGLNYVCERLDGAAGRGVRRGEFYAMFSVQPQPKTVVHVCDDLACRVQGGEELLDRGSRRRAPTATGPGRDRSPCLGMCEQAPAVARAARGPPGRGARRGDARRPSGRPRARVAGHVCGGASPRRRRGTPAFARASGCCDGSARSIRSSIDDYRAVGGYAALRRAIELGPEGDDPARSTDAKLLGRGGAAFPTGVKWKAVAEQSVRPHYVICNADESEPGTFKDRLVMELDPFAVVEALTIAGFATGAERGYLYVRGEYPLATRTAGGTRSRRRGATGYLGDDVMGTGSRSTSSSGAAPARTSAARRPRCSTRSRASAASRGTSRRSRSTRGLFGKPTAINNVETLINVLPILDARRGRRTPGSAPRDSTGTRLFCLSGHVERPGVYELRTGSTLGDAIEPAGGVRGGRRAEGGAARRRGGWVRGAGSAGRAADVRGRARRRVHPRLGRDHGLRRGHRPGRPGPADRAVLP